MSEMWTRVNRAWSGQAKRYVYRIVLILVAIGALYGLGQLFDLWLLLRNERPVTIYEASSQQFRVKVERTGNDYTLPSLTRVVIRDLSLSSPEWQVRWNARDFVADSARVTFLQADSIHVIFFAGKGDSTWVDLNLSSSRNPFEIYETRKL